MWLTPCLSPRNLQSAQKLKTDWDFAKIGMFFSPPIVPTGNMPTMSSLRGRWKKDKENTDMSCFSTQLDLLRVGGIKKATAMKLINGLTVRFI